MPSDIKARRSPPHWSFEEANNSCLSFATATHFLVTYVYELEPGRRTAVNLLIKDEARRIAAKHC